ncbi:MAG: cytochrome C, partial [Loktanella sp.]|nr:cytochrome C [Loktanella sp.]
RYSKGLVSAGEEMGMEWNEETFVAYVQDPTGWMRETLDDNRARSKMAYKLRSDEDAADVWAYITSLDPEAGS